MYNTARGWERMCSDKDCQIFRGMIMACDACNKQMKLSQASDALMAKAPQSPTQT